MLVEYPADLQALPCTLCQAPARCIPVCAWLAARPLDTYTPAVHPWLLGRLGFGGSQIRPEATGEPG